MMALVRYVPVHLASVLPGGTPVSEAVGNVLLAGSAVVDGAAVTGIVVGNAEVAVGEEVVGEEVVGEIVDDGPIGTSVVGRDIGARMMVDTVIGSERSSRIACAMPCELDPDRL